jgi:hypothetical protein
MAEVPQTGRVRWIGVRPESRADMLELDAVEARREAGLTGDHARPGARNARQVTLIQWEHLAVINSLLGRTADQPILAQDLRRNLVVSGINLFSLKGRRFRGWPGHPRNHRLVPALRAPGTAPWPRDVPGGTRPRRDHGTGNRKRDHSSRRRTAGRAAGAARLCFFSSRLINAVAFTHPATSI